VTPTSPLNWLSHDELLAESAIGSIPGHRPHERQHLGIVRRLLVDLFDRPHDAMVPLGPEESVVVVGVDAISWKAASANWSPDRLVPLTTTFPSTSACAWVSALTGLGPADSGVAGAVYRVASADAAFNPFTDRAHGWAGSGSERPPLPEARCGPWDTVFTDVSRLGVRPWAIPGDLQNFAGRWTDALLQGAELVASSAPWDRLRYLPDRLVAAAIEDLDRILAERRDRASLGWILLNLDDYVHHAGYDRHTQAALRQLDSAFRRWADAGHVVVSFADHGMVANTMTLEEHDRFDDIGSADRCRLPPGGAGRVRWLHPKPGRIGEVRTRIESDFGDRASVLPRDALAELGLLPRGVVLDEAVGEVVCLATGDWFPVPDPRACFEHGSVTADEMMVPLAVWSAR
jgi:hypothetical protein